MLDRFLHGDRSRTKDLPTGADGRTSAHRPPETMPGNRMARLCRRQSISCADP
jgi:hypothetical protein